MSDDRTALQTVGDTNESLGELLRSRALASSPRLLAGQAIAGIGINAAVLLWHPKHWGIATAAFATIALHALWSFAVLRTDDVEFANDEDEANTADTATDEDKEEFANNANSSDDNTRSTAWWRVRQFSAIGASASALALLWFVCMMLLGRLMS